MKLRHIVTVLFLASMVMLSTGCAAVQQGGATTQPQSGIATEIQLAAAGYDLWRPQVDLFAQLALGPNPSASAIKDYNTAVWWTDYYRKWLTALGAPVPADANPPKMIVK